MLAVCSGIVLALKGNKDSWTLLSTSESIVYSKQYLFSTLDNWRNLFSVLTSRWQADYLELITTFQKFSDRHKFRPKREFSPRQLESFAREISDWRSLRDLDGPMASPRLPRPSGRRRGHLLLPAPMSVCLHLWARENEVTCRADTVRTALKSGFCFNGRTERFAHLSFSET